MIFKKLVSVISALAITISMFTGLTITANAAEYPYYLTFVKDGITIETMNAVDQATYDQYKTGSTFTVDSGDNAGSYIVVSSEVTNFDFSVPKIDVKVTVREPQIYKVTLAAYSEDTFLGSIGTVQVNETAENYTYSYPAYIVYGNQLYKKTDTGGSYTVEVQGTVKADTTLNVGGYTLEEGYTDATIQLQEPSGSTVDGASKGDAGTKVEFTLPKQGQYTVIARYQGSVTAKNGETDVSNEFTDSTSGEWKDVTTTFKNTSSESSTFSMTANDENSYIDYVVLIRTGDAMSTLSYSKKGDGEGTVTVNGDQLSTEQSYDAVVGSKQTIVVSAGNGSYIKDVSIEGAGNVEWGSNETTRTATITMPADNATLNVEFGKLYKITINNEENGTVIADAQTAKKGDTITFTASANDGYVTGDISVTYNGSELVNVADNKTFIMPAADVTINVSFDKLRTVSLARAVIGGVEGDNPGTISSSDPLTVSDEKATVNVTADTARGYRFVKFVYVETSTKGESIPELGYYEDESVFNEYNSVDGSPIEGSDKGMYGQVTGPVEVPQNDITVIAVFEKLEPITFDTSSVTGGTLTPSLEQVYPGDTFGVEAKADEGYYDVTEITVNDVTIAISEGEYTVPYFTEEEYPTTITLSATFVAIPQYEVKTETSLTNTNYGDSTTYGEILVSGLIPSNTDYAYKDSVITVSAVAETGYELVEIKIEGVEESEIENKDGTYTFTMPDRAVVITAKFKWINKLPENANAEFQGEFNDDGSAASSWYYGKLIGQGLAYKPFVSVTVDHNGGEMTKTALSNTIITSGNISIAVVVDKSKDEVKNVTLSGKDSSYTDTGEHFEVNNPNSSKGVE